MPEKRVYYFDDDDICIGHSIFVEGIEGITHSGQPLKTKVEIDGRIDDYGKASLRYNDATKEIETVKRVNKGTDQNPNWQYEDDPDFSNIKVEAQKVRKRA